MVESLALARFNKTADVDKIGTLDVLRAALDEPEVQDATHVIVVYGKLEEDGSCRNGWMQGGKLDAFAQVGLLNRVLARFAKEPD